jgi:hypothetical protein
MKEVETFTKLSSNRNKPGEERSLAAVGDVAPDDGNLAGTLMSHTGISIIQVFHAHANLCIIMTQMTAVELVPVHRIWYRPAYVDALAPGTWHLTFVLRMSYA